MSSFNDFRSWGGRSRPSGRPLAPTRATHALLSKMANPNPSSRYALSWGPEPRYNTPRFDSVPQGTVEGVTWVDFGAEYDHAYAMAVTTRRIPYVEEGMTITGRMFRNWQANASPYPSTDLMDASSFNQATRGFSVAGSGEYNLINGNRVAVGRPITVMGKVYAYADEWPSEPETEPEEDDEPPSEDNEPVWDGFALNQDPVDEPNPDFQYVQRLLRPARRLSSHGCGTQSRIG